MNESHGTVNSATGGYHETVTRAYVQLLAAFSERHADQSPAERVTALLAGELADRGALLTFYSSAWLGSAEARLDWVDPDLAPLALDAIVDRRAG